MSRAYSVSARLDEERIVAAVVVPDDGLVMLRFRNGARATELSLSIEAFRVLGDMAIAWFDGRPRSDADKERP